MNGVIIVMTITHTITSVSVSLNHNLFKERGT